MNFIRRIWNSWHRWVYRTDDTRACKVCGRVERYSMGYDYGDAGYDVWKKGNASKHKIF